MFLLVAGIATAPDRPRANPLVMSSKDRLHYRCSAVDRFRRSALHQQHAEVTGQGAAVEVSAHREAGGSGKSQLVRVESFIGGLV